MGRKKKVDVQPLEAKDLLKDNDVFKDVDGVIMSLEDLQNFTDQVIDRQTKYMRDFIHNNSMKISSELNKMREYIENDYSKVVTAQDKHSRYMLSMTYSIMFVAIICVVLLILSTLFN